MKKIKSFLILVTLLLGSKAYAQNIATYESVGLNTFLTANPTITTLSNFAIDNLGNTYITTGAENRIIKITKEGVYSIFTGTADEDVTADGSLAAARFNGPREIIFHNKALYVIDVISKNLRKIDLVTNTVSTVTTFTATPTSLTADADGNFYLTFGTKNHIGKLSGTTLTVFAGNETTAGDTGANGGATSATLNTPKGVFATADYLYFIDAGNQKVKRIKFADNTIQDYVGIKGEFNLTIANAIGSPAYLTVSKEEVVFLSNEANNVILRVGTDKKVILMNTINLTNIASTENAVFKGSSLFDPGKLMVRNDTLFVLERGIQKLKFVKFNAPTANFTIAANALYTTTKNPNLAFTFGNAEKYAVSESESNLGTFISPIPTNSTSYTLSATDGLKTLYFQTSNGLNQVSSLISKTITLDQTAPTGSFTINNGDATTASLNVALNLAGITDATSGLDKMSFSNNGTTYSTPETFSPSKAWVLTSGDGNKTVYIKVTDKAGNTSTAFSKSINYEAVLPVTLISYDAIAQNQAAVLTWKTSQEISNQYYTIERSTDGILFTKLNQLAAKKQAGTLTYNFTDKQPVNGVNYYQLSQTDENGETTVLGVKPVNFIINSASEINLYSNPNNGQFQVNLGDNSNKAIDVKIYNVNGKLVWNKKLTVSNGVFNVSLANILKPGVYIIDMDAYGSKRFVVID